MTATERVYKQTSSGKDDVVSMDNPEIYGDVFHHLTFKEAIKQKIICDYKIITIAVSEKETAALIAENPDLRVTTGKDSFETDAHNLSVGLTLQKIFEKHGIKHAVTFHSSIKRATFFTQQQQFLITTHQLRALLPAQPAVFLARPRAVATASSVLDGDGCTRGECGREIFFKQHFDTKGVQTTLLLFSGRARHAQRLAVAAHDKQHASSAACCCRELLLVGVCGGGRGTDKLLSSPRFKSNSPLLVGIREKTDDDADRSGGCGRLFRGFERMRR